MGNIAGILTALGQLGGAQDMYDRALELQRKLLATDHPEIATTLSNLGALYRRRKDYEAAIPVFLEALAIRSKVFPPDHPAVLTSQNMLAVSHQDQGEPGKALELAQAVLSAREAKLGEHTQVAGSYYTVGSILKALGRLSESDTHLRRSIEIYGSQLPSDHLDRVRPMAFLGQSLAERGKAAEARPLLEEALRVRRGKLPTEHPAVQSLEGILRSLIE